MGTLGGYFAHADSFFDFFSDKLTEMHEGFIKETHLTFTEVSLNGAVCPYLAQFLQSLLGKAAALFQLFQADLQQLFLFLWDRVDLVHSLPPFDLQRG